MLTVKLWRLQGQKKLNNFKKENKKTPKKAKKTVYSLYFWEDDSELPWQEQKQFLNLAGPGPAARNGTKSQYRWSGRRECQTAHWQTISADCWGGRASMLLPCRVYMDMRKTAPSATPFSLIVDN